ncbi:helix-turn-helix domain-containing protein [Klebsiella aerogenes]
MTSSFNMTEQIYSSTNFDTLTDKLKMIGRVLHYTKGVTLQPRKGEILILLSGQMTITDSNDEGLAIGHTFSFMPLGLLEHYYHLALHYQTETKTAVAQLTIEEFNSIFFHTTEFAELLCKIMAYMSSSLIHIYYERNNESGYATIREMLQRYMFKMEQGTLGNEGIAAFILKRTRLSRSYVFQVLAGLKAGHYITVHNGKLRSINRDIPERF